MTIVELVAVSAAVLLCAVAVFQVALAVGAPWGEATLGGRAATVDGVLTFPFRLLAAISALVLVAAAGIILTRAGVIDCGLLGDSTVFWMTWGIVGFMALNTLGNASARHPVERWVMSSITLVVTIFCAIVALRAPV
jgi:hypothetical protein